MTAGKRLRYEWVLGSALVAIRVRGFLEMKNGLAGGFFAEKNWVGLTGWDWDSGRGWFCAAEILPLQDDVGEEERESYAGPDDGFGDGLAQGFPTCDAGDHPYFEKDDGDGEAADHPLAVLLDFASEDEHEGDGGSGHPESGVGGGGEAEGARGAHALFEILDVGAERGSDEDAGDVDAADDAMEFGITLAKAIRELHGAEKEGTGSGYAVGKEPPLKGLDVRPFAILGVEEKAFIVDENVGNHEADESKEKIFWTRQGKTGKRAGLIQAFAPLFEPGKAGDQLPMRCGENNFP